MIWAIWREIYRQDLCLSFNQWLLRVISVNRCLIFKVHHPLRNRLSRAVFQVSFAIIPNRPPFVNTFFQSFSLFYYLSSNSSACCFYPRFSLFDFCPSIWQLFLFHAPYIAFLSLFSFLWIYLDFAFFAAFFIFSSRFF